MNDAVLQLEHSVEAQVSVAAAWRYRTDVTKWNDPPAQFHLEGEFREGAQGTTTMPGQPPFHWTIRNLRERESFSVEMQLDRATLTFEWNFVALTESRTRLTQRVLLLGENAASYAAQVEAGFAPTLADGMERVARELELHA
jgi:hypothetical protein